MRCFYVNLRRAFFMDLIVGRGCLDRCRLVVYFGVGEFWEMIVFCLLMDFRFSRMLVFVFMFWFEVFGVT